MLRPIANMQPEPSAPNLGGMNAMPVVIPPAHLDVPAIVRSAARAPAAPATVPRPATPPPGVTRPAGGSQDPAIVAPPPSPPPPPPPPSTSTDTAARGPRS